MTTATEDDKYVTYIAKEGSILWGMSLSLQSLRQLDPRSKEHSCIGNG